MANWTNILKWALFVDLFLLFGIGIALLVNGGRQFESGLLVVRLLKDD